MIINKEQKLETKLCECGCGEYIPKFDKRGHELKYKLYHRIIEIGKKCKGIKLTKEHKLKISLSNKGKKRLCKPTIYWLGKNFSEEHKEKIAIAGRKRKHSLKTKHKQSIAHMGSNSGWWKGGITPINAMIRNSAEYKLWRNAVFERDNWKCIWCNSKERIEADHIKPFSLFPELRFAIDNGRTLCHKCHKTTETYGNKINSLNKNENTRKTRIK